MPFTHWVEGKIHKTTITKSSPQLRKDLGKNKPKLKTGINLREAITQARNEFEGTILSADKVESDGGMHYLIKILSSNGLIKQIKVDGSNKDKQAPTPQTPQTPKELAE